MRCAVQKRCIIFSSFIEGSFTYHKIHPLYMYSTVVFSKFMGLCNYDHSPILEHFSYPQITWGPSCSPSLCCLQPQEITHLLSVFMNLPWTYISYGQSSYFANVINSLERLGDISVWLRMKFRMLRLYSTHRVCG